MIPEINQFKCSSYPGIFSVNIETNPMLSAPTAGFDILFAQTKDTMEDPDVYKKFLSSAIKTFRGSPKYKNYKAHLMDEIGLDSCQYHGNIKSGSEDQDMATIEMHHHILTIYDIAYIITEHILNSNGCITTMDLIKMLGIEHTEHRVATVMLCKTCHQLQHNHEQFFLSSSLAFGNWVEFLQRFPLGVNGDIYKKIYFQIKKDLTTLESSENKALELLSIANTLEDWSAHNEKLFGRSCIDIFEKNAAF